MKQHQMRELFPKQLSQHMDHSNVISRRPDPQPEYNRDPECLENSTFETADSEYSSGTDNYELSRDSSAADAILFSDKEKSARRFDARRIRDISAGFCVALFLCLGVLLLDGFQESHKPGNVLSSTETKENDVGVMTSPVENEVDINEFCAYCRWKDSGFSCGSRVSWLIRHHDMSEQEAKKDVIPQCAKPTKEDTQEVDLDQFCDACKWNGTSYSCEQRAQYLVKMYYKSLTRAKNEIMSECLKPTEDEKNKKKEEILKMDEKLSHDNFCGECKWGRTDFTCDQRVGFLVNTYGISESEAKYSVLSECAGPRRLVGS